MEEIDKKSTEMFKGEFNERLFRQRIALFFDINYSEPVEYMPGFQISRFKIQERLRELSLS